MITRRELLKILGLSSVYIITYPLFANEDTMEVFPSGVASGDPTQNSIIIWTRINPQIHQKMKKTLKLYLLSDLQGDPDKALKQALIKEFNIDPDKITPDNDYTVRLRLSSLMPGRQYFYMFEYAGVKRIGRFKTLPTKSSEVSFAFVTCQNYEDGYYPAFKHIANEDIQFVLHLGDAIYERVYGVKVPGRELYLPSGNKFAISLDDYRYLYKTYLSDQNYQLARSMHPFIYIWDDHEFVNDYYYDYSKESYNSPSLPKNLRENKEAISKLRKASIKAWYEYIPANVEFNFDNPIPKNWIKIYRDFKIDGLIHLICTDERSYRESQCPIRFQSPGCETQQTHTMLGKEQLSWFLDKLKEGNYTWKVWANEVQFVSSKIDGLYGSTDAWDGYVGERQKIIDFLSENEINVVVLTGDRHSFLSAEIPNKFDNNYTKVLGVEFMTGAISSINASEAGWWKRDLPKYETIDEYTQAELSQNPWEKFLNSKTWGYSILTLNSNIAQCTFYSVNKYKQNAEKEVLARFKYDKTKLEKN